VKKLKSNGDIFEFLEYGTVQGPGCSKKCAVTLKKVIFVCKTQINNTVMTMQNFHSGFSFIIRNNKLTSKECEILYANRL